MVTPIVGYRNLSEDEIECINHIKHQAEMVGALVDRLKNSISNDQRWIAIGKTDLQTGFMALARAVAKPTTF